jgi:hypothetical protein
MNKNMERYKDFGWYRQNIILYVKDDKIGMVKYNENDICKNYPHPSMVIPEIYNGMKFIRDNDINKISLKRLIVIKQSVKKLLGEKLTERIKRIKRKKNGT